MLNHQLGLTLLEAMVSITIMTILAVITVPLFLAAQENRRLHYINDSFANDLKFAQSEALRRQTNVFVSIKTGENWCYGIDDVADCNCGVANDCQYLGVETVRNASDYNITRVQTTGLAAGVGGSGFSSIQFDGNRGTISTTGSTTFVIDGSLGVKSVITEVNRLGRGDSCSNTVPGYQQC